MYHHTYSWFETGLDEGLDNVIMQMMFFYKNVSDLLWTRRQLFIWSFPLATFVETPQRNSPIIDWVTFDWGSDNFRRVNYSLNLTFSYPTKILDKTSNINNVENFFTIHHMTQITTGLYWYTHTHKYIRVQFVIHPPIPTNIQTCAPTHLKLLSNKTI